MVKNKHHLHSRLQASYIVYRTEGVLSGEIGISETNQLMHGAIERDNSCGMEKYSCYWYTHTGGIYRFNQNIKAPCRLLCLSNLNPILHT